MGHLIYPSQKFVASGEPVVDDVNKDFIQWLNKTILKYEQAGAKVVMVPPVCVKSHFKIVYNDNISTALKRIGHPYIIEPSTMAFEDSCSFNSGYHVNKEGVERNTSNLIMALRPYCCYGTDFASMVRDD